LSEKVRLTVNPNKMQEVKEKYGLTEEALKDVLDGVSVSSAETEEEEPETIEGVPTSQLFRKIAGGEFTMVDYLMYSDMQERREERRRRLESLEKDAKVTPETIAVALAKALKDAGIGSAPSKPREEEMPDWAKKQGDQLNQITNKLAKDEEEKRLKDTVGAAVKPLEDELARTKEELGKTKEELKPKEKPKGELETTRDTLKTLSEIDDLRGRGTELPEGTPGEITVATKTLDKGEKVLTKGMDDVKETVSQVLEFQLEREKRMFKQQAPKLPEITEEEKEKTLKAAVGVGESPEGKVGG